MITSHEIDSINAADEATNCFAEARAACAARNVAQAVAPFVVNVRAAYYCRATDAFAGYFLAESRGFATRAEAEAFSQATFEANDELDIEVLPRVPTLVVRDTDNVSPF